MVEQIRISPEEVRGYGNVCEEHSLDDFIVSSSALAKEKETVHGALTDVYKLVYSLYGLMFAFDNGNKQLYLQMGEADLLSFGFDDDGKQLYLLDMAGTGLSLGFDEDTNELYISDAPPIVHNYSLAFNSSSYVATDGSAEVSVTLLDDNVEVSGATVTFTGGTSTVTGVTNGSGVATATVSVSATSTITATYQNVTDTCTITVPSQYIFYDECNSSSGLSNYGTIPHKEGSSDHTYSISFDSRENAYFLTNINDDEGECCITPLTGITDDFRLEVDMKRTVNSAWCALQFVQNTGNGFFYGGSSGTWQGHYYQNNSWRGSISGGGTSLVDTWYHLELVKEGTSITINCYDSTGETLLKSATRTYANSDNYYGITLTGYFKNVKAEYI